MTLILALYLLTSAIGGIIGGTFRTVGAVAGAAGTTVGAAAPKAASIAGIDEGDVRSEAAAHLYDAPNDPSQMTVEQAQREIAKELPALVSILTHHVTGWYWQVCTVCVGVSRGYAKIAASLERRRVNARTPDTSSPRPSRRPRRPLAAKG